MSSSVATKHETASVTLWEKLHLVAAIAVAAGLFLTLGRMALSPEDPLGPLTLYTHHSGTAMWVQALALAVVATGAATVLAGRTFLDVGVLAACTGLVAVSLRAATADEWLAYAGEAGQLNNLGLKWVAESAAWMFVVLACMQVGTLMTRWCLGTDHLMAFPQRRNAPRPLMAGVDLGVHFLRKPPVDRERATPPADGLRHFLAFLMVGTVITGIMLEGLGTRATRHGQVCFVVAGAVAIAAYVAHRFFPVRSAAWSILGAWALALVRYLWGWLAPGSGEPVILNINPVLRILPIQFIGVGTAVAILMYWNYGAHYYLVDVERHAAPTGSSREGRGGAKGRRR